MSFFNLFLNADFVVKLVILILLSASIGCWAIIIAKSAQLRKAQGLAKSFEKSFWHTSSLENFYDRLGPKPMDALSAVFVTGMREWVRMKNHVKKLSYSERETVRQRIENLMNIRVQKEMEPFEKHINVLGTVGSTAPFIGLFGTVWGIMNSFQSIAASKSTNLAVVAPGMAEALFATALGLVAAIPAVMAYNRLTHQIDLYQSRVTAFVQEFSILISRQFEQE